jgi:hypothetical protein
MRCKFCGGAAHPATGCVYGPTTIACRRCTLEAWRWIKGHTNRQARRSRGGVVPSVSFYEAAGRK